MRPLLREMVGLPREERLRRGRLGSDLSAEGTRMHFLRAALENVNCEEVVTPFPDQDSARLGLLAEADALLVRPPNDPARKKGTFVEFMRLD